MPTIDQLIPQRPPFQLIDRLLDLEPGGGATATKLVTINDWYFDRNAEAPKRVPRPLMIEMLAQTGAAAILAATENGQNVFLGGVQTATFYEDAHPGDVLTASVQLTKLRRQIGSGHGELRRAGQLIATAELRFAIQT
ncbi:3-hydroxyacyl-ACP dehydratase FabZ family protein [Lactiplantibacillus modestisalitolerans]|uniref:3-hydroxyacyl-ACP dehydratase FabZ family protein n=1 Tax=Lactiplantibacillus modestisalitolerans TaxID=1457219 RepID=A0ABV5WWI2_9LACO|nr:3-hydroxyacyl-ACP dehydratase FabZ family protein [Lactiplantibacillus modestisalitolerans]